MTKKNLLCCAAYDVFEMRPVLPEFVQLLPVHKHMIVVVHIETTDVGLWRRVRFARTGRKEVGGVERPHFGNVVGRFSSRAHANVVSNLNFKILLLEEKKDYLNQLKYYCKPMVKGKSIYLLYVGVRKILK